MALTKVTGQVINNTTDVTVGVLTVTNTLAVGGTVSIGGTLTYEDVTNVDAVGLITARDGIVVGSGITLSVDGDGFFTGVITATSYSGIDLSDVTGATGDFSIADKIIHTGDTNTAIRFPDADTITAETGGSERLRITSDGKIGINKSSPSNFLHVAGSGYQTARFENTDNGADGAYVELYNNSSSPADNDYNGIISFKNRNSAAEEITYSQIRAQSTDVTDGTEDGNLTFHTRANGTFGERARIDSSGRILIGTTTEGNASADDLTIAGSDNTGITIRSGTAHQGGIYFSDATSGNAEFDGFIVYDQNSRDLRFGTQQATRMRVDSGGRLLIGGTSHQEVYGTNAFQIAGTTGATSSMSLLRHGNSPYLVLGSSGGSSLGAVTALSSGNRIGQLTFAGADGTDINTHAASIAAYVNGSVSSNTVPARISFQFGSSETEKVRIDSNGVVNIGDATYGSSLGQVRIINNAESAPASLSLFGYGNTTDNDAFAQIQFAEQENSTNGQVKAKIEAQAVSTAERGSNLVFFTSANTSSSTPQERLRITEDGYVLKNNHPAFGARQLSNASTNAAVDSAGTAIFSTVFLNSGNHYSNSTGVFTCPVAGIYHFSCTMLVDDNASTNSTYYVDIRKNGSQVTRLGYDYRPNTETNAYHPYMAGSVTLSAAASDEITIYMNAGGFHVGGEANFSGHLIG